MGITERVVPNMSIFCEPASKIVQVATTAWYILKSEGFTIGPTGVNLLRSLNAEDSIIRYLYKDTKGPFSDCFYLHQIGRAKLLMWAKLVLQSNFTL